MRKLLFFVGLVSLFSACTTLQTVSFDRLQAADVNFPEQVRRVGIVNNLPQDVEAQDNRVEGDGKIASEVLAQEIAATDYFDRVVICDSALHNSASPLDASLSPAKADSLIQALGVDVLLSFERISIELKDGLLLVPELMTTVPAVDGIIVPIVKAYVSGRPTPLFVVSKSDTLSWEVTPTLTLAGLVKEASEYAGVMPMEHLLPRWTEQQRFYFDGGSVEMRDAGVCIREQDWGGAAVLWKDAYNRTKGKKKLRVAYNLALYHEMQDDFEQAEEYLKVAESLAESGSWESQLIQLYRSQLEEQMVEYQKLKIQMKRFE